MWLKEPILVPWKFGAIMTEIFTGIISPFYLNLSKMTELLLQKLLLSWWKISSNSIKSHFEKLIGFYSRSASIYKGRLNGVIKSLKEENKNILFVINWVSHAIHNISKKECKHIPDEVLKFVGKVVKFFKKSAGKLERLKVIASIFCLLPFFQFQIAIFLLY